MSLFFQIGFQFLALSLLFQHPHVANVGMFEVVPEATYTILIWGISFFFLLFRLAIFLLPYIPNHWFDSWLHPLYCLFPVNCSSFQLVFPLFPTGSFFMIFVLFYTVEVLSEFICSSPSSLSILMTSALNSASSR